MTQNLSRLLDRFPEVVEDPAGYLVPCPAHDDAHPSLLLTLKQDGRLLVYCRAGCDRDAVLAAMPGGPFRQRDLFGWVPGDGARVRTGGQRRQGPGPDAIAGLRVWLDAAAERWDAPELLPLVEQAAVYLQRRFGLDLRTAERFGIGLSPQGAIDAFPYLSPRFRSYPRIVVPLIGFDNTARGAQGRDISGQCEARWVSLSSSARRDDPAPIAWAQYGVLPGQEADAPVIITEGPGDALTAAALGYTAVAIRGAGLARNAALADELASGLRGRDVWVAGDADRAGREFTERISAALRERGVTTRHLIVPHAGEDLSDWRARDEQAFPELLRQAMEDASPVGQQIQAVDKRAAAPITGRVVPRGAGMEILTQEDAQSAAQIVDELAAVYGDSDAMRAHAFAAFNAGRIRYARGLGFYVWNGRTWEPSETRVRSAIHSMGAALMMAGRLREARAFGATSRIDAMLTELRAVPTVAVDASQFDSRPDLLAFRNGTVELRTGQLRPHRMEDMLTQMIDMDYDPHAEAPRWLQFMGEVFPDHPEMVDYMQRLIGYGITGETVEQCFAVLLGKGANGKTVLTDTLTCVFRDIVRTTPFSTFEARQGGGIPNDLAALRGSRLVMASEGEAGKPMAEEVLKRVTGTEMISARFLRQEFFEYRPSFLLLLATNHRPRFRGQDDGLWRRVKLLQFNRYFAPHERDPYLADRLRQEAPGIIAWAVRGAVEWYRGGLQDPSVVRDATREYRETSDPLSGFFASSPDEDGILVRDPEGRVLGNEAYNRYLEWWEEENLQGKPWSRPGFYGELEDRGAMKRKTERGITLFGVRLASNAEAAGTLNGGVSDAQNSGPEKKIFES